MIGKITLAGLINVYVIETPRGHVLVDTGAPLLGGLLRRELRRAGVDARRLAGVVLTHFHIDHAGNAAALASLGVPVFASAADAAILRGQAEHPGYGGRAGRVLHRMERRLLPLRPLAVRDLSDGEPLMGGEWRVVAVPGHSPGSLALWHPRYRSLISGDTLVATFGRARGPVPVFTADLPAAQSSALRLLDLEPRVIHPGHGPSLDAAAYDHWRRRTAPRPSAAEAV
jgi:glyoxylase-like metal-dependent hydrolase (beta-lactamase superfamily II)